MSKCPGVIYNIILIIIIQLIFLFSVVAPLQFVAKYSAGDSFAIVILLYSTGIAWYQCYTIAQKLFRKSDATNGQWEQLGKEGSTKLSKFETVGKCCYFIYKVISFALATISVHSALIILRLSCPSPIPFKTIKICSTSECIHLYLSSIACHYWFIAPHVISTSLYFFEKLASNTAETRNNVEECEILENA